MSNYSKAVRSLLKSIRTAESNIDVPVEIVVSLNRCTDKTEKIAKNYNAVIVKEDEKNIAKIRNAGVKVSSGDVLVTIDADSWMTSNILQELILKLQSGKYIGGGVRTKPERLSTGIFFSILMVMPYMLKAGISAGMFWLYKQDFEAIGGFNERHVSVEDFYFAIKLKARWKTKDAKIWNY